MLFFLGLSSAVVYFKNIGNSKKDLRTLLSGPDALNADFRYLCQTDFKFMPEDFIARAAPAQWRQIRAVAQSHMIPPKIKHAIYERERLEQEVVSYEGGGQPVEDSGDVPRFNPVENNLSTSFSCRIAGPDLIKHRNIAIDDIFVFKDNGYVEKRAQDVNALRRRGYNFLRGTFDNSKLSTEQQKLLEEWAVISIVCSFGLKKGSEQMKLMNWLKGVSIFNPKSQVPTESWISLIENCKNANGRLWNEMLKLSMDRLRLDPILAKEDTDSLSAKVSSNSTVLKRQMEKILRHQPPKKSQLPKMKKSRSAGGYTIPFMADELPRITEAFTKDFIVIDGKAVPGSIYRRPLIRYYRILEGKVVLDCSDDEKLLVTEWAMIAVIFHRSNAPRPLCHLIRWILSIPLDFVRLKKKADILGDISLEESIGYARAGKAVNPALWDDLAMVAAERFLADPQRQPLPLLEAWCKRKGKIDKRLGKRLNTDQDRSHFDMAVRRPRSLAEILDSLKSDDVDFLLKALEEARRSLVYDSEQIPNGELFARQLEKFLQ